jgi:hypothetical protein
MGGADECPRLASVCMLMMVGMAAYSDVVKHVPCQSLLYKLLY